MLSDAVAALDYDVAATCWTCCGVDLPRRTPATTSRGPRATWRSADLGCPPTSSSARREWELYPTSSSPHRRRCGFADALAEIVSSN